MRADRYLSLAVVVLSIAACNPFHHENPVQVSTGDVNLNLRWHGALVTPAELSGAVQMKGVATMAPGPKSGTTRLTLDISNAAPGGTHPWAVHRGQCGSDDGVLGSPDSYQEIKIGDDGTGTSVATINLDTPTTGSYFVNVLASATNRETVVACGNLAPPTR